MAGDPSQEQSAAREEVMKCEKEIQSIKAALRRLGGVGNADEPNSLDVVLIKVEGLPVAAKPTVHLQLSSPIEEGKISEVYDELNSDSVPEGSFVTFNGVETSTATLTVSVDDADIPLGSSRPQDLAPLFAMDPLEAKDEYVTEFRVAIVGEDSHSASAAASEENESESMDVAPEPLCTVTFKVTYKPSPKDQREGLYEVLNKTSQRKASALENLRKISMAMSRESSSAPPNKAAGTVAKPSVKPGFLNKKKSTEPTRMQKLYENTIGPNSMLVKGFSVALVARNYLIFFGAVATFHFKGQLLSLPPPV